MNNSQLMYIYTVIGVAALSIADFKIGLMTACILLGIASELRALRIFLKQLFLDATVEDPNGE